MLNYLVALALFAETPAVASEDRVKVVVELPEDNPRDLQGREAFAQQLKEMSKTAPEEDTVWSQVEALDLTNPVHVGFSSSVSVFILLFSWWYLRSVLRPSEPILRKKHFNVFGKVVWLCARCESKTPLHAHSCPRCGQPQVWPKWSFAKPTR